MIDKIVRNVYMLVSKQTYMGSTDIDISSYTIAKDDKEYIVVAFGDKYQKIYKGKFTSDEILIIFAVSSELTGDFENCIRAIKILQCAQSVDSDIIYFSVKDMESISHLSALLKLKIVAIVNNSDEKLNLCFKSTIICGNIYYICGNFPAQRVYCVKNMTDAMEIAKKLDPFLIFSFG